MSVEPNILSLFTRVLLSYVMMRMITTYSQSGAISAVENTQRFFGLSL